MQRLPLLLVLLAAPAVAQNARLPERVALVTAFHGPPGGSGDLALYEDQRGAPVATPGWARDLWLLPLDFVGRTALDELAADRPRFRDDVPGASRLELPGGNGTLYRYARQLAAGRHYGFLRVGPDGAPQRVLERPGSGASQDVDPFLARVAIDAAGEALLAATTVAAGGDLFEVALATGAATNRTPHLPALAFYDAGLGLAQGWGFGVASSGVLRFARVAGANAHPVPMPDPPPTWFSGQAVQSPARTFALTGAGDGPALQHALVFGPAGPARRASAIADSLSGAGFLPESLHGPYLAVSDDGQLAAWRTEGLMRECYLARVEPVPDPLQATDDPFFVDTLDEIGQVNLSAPGALTLAVGERNAVDGTIEKVDLYEVRLDVPGQPTFTNLTRSSGDLVVPFTPGTISPEFARRLPVSGELLVYDEDGDRLLGLSPGQVGTTVHLTDVKQVHFAERGGAQLLLGLRRTFGSKPGELHRVELDLTGWTQLVGGGDDVEFFDAVGHASGQVVLRTVVGGNQDYLQRVDLPTGSVDTWQPNASDFGTPFGFTAGGAALFAQGPAAGPVVLRVWPLAGPAFDLGAPIVPGFVLR